MSETKRLGRGLEALLGLKIAPDGFRIEPCIPAAWNGFSLTLRRGEATYKIDVRNPGSVERGVRKIEVNGAPVDDKFVRFDPEARGEIQVTVVMGG